MAGNYIGTDATGTIALANRGAGVGIGDGARLNTIGGTTPAERNVISGNNDAGVSLLHSDTMSNTIAYNYIGTTASGTSGLGNRWGISCVAGSQSLTIKNNVISSNKYHGIQMAGCDHSTIAGNIIGADPSGAVHLGNGANGINLQDDARRTSSALTTLSPTILGAVSASGMPGPCLIPSHATRFTTMKHAASISATEAMPI